MTDKEAFIELNKKFKNSDGILGRTVLTFPGTMSSSRGILTTSQIEQAETLLRPEKPRVYTGYEREFGSYSRGISRADDNFVVIDKICKFKDTPNEIYMLIIKRADGMYDVIHKKSYEELSENYCYKYNTEVIDSLKCEDVVPKDTVLYKSTSFDERMNWRYGINLRAVYICDVRTTEDAFLMSKSAAKKFDSPKQDKVKIILNDNDLLLNMYGTVDEYRSFPDINEEIYQKKVCGKRRIINDEILFSMTSNRLMQLYDDDEVYVAHAGSVLKDVCIYCNRDYKEMCEEFKTMIPSNPNYQVYKYYMIQQDYYLNTVSALNSIIKIAGRENCSDDLKYTLKRCQELTSEHKFTNNETIYSNMIIELKLLSVHHLGKGGKIVGRYGDKGVLSDIVDDDLMPQIKLCDGTIVAADIVANPYGVPNRTNLGQLFEVELGLRSDQLIHKMGAFNDETKFMIFADFVTIASPALAKYILERLKTWTVEDRISFMNDLIYDKKYLPVRESPFWDCVGLDVLELIDKKMRERYGIVFEKYDMYVKKFGRTIKARRQVVSGHKYFMKLKHCPESKFSARSSGVVNPRGLPNKSRSSKQNKSLYSNTPVRFGNQEIMLFMIGNNSERIIHKMLMLHSSSIKGRKCVGELLDTNVLDPYIDLPEDATDRNTEILKMYLRTMGIGLSYHHTEINPFYMGNPNIENMPYNDNYNLDLCPLSLSLTNEDEIVVSNPISENGICIVKQRVKVDDKKTKGRFSLINEDGYEKTIDDFLFGETEIIEG